MSAFLVIRFLQKTAQKNAHPGRKSGNAGNKKSERKSRLYRLPDFRLKQFNSNVNYFSEFFDKKSTDNSAL